MIQTALLLYLRYLNYIFFIYRHIYYLYLNPSRAPAYKLTYFDGKGRGEVIRMAFVLGGVKFQDERISFQEWPALKESKYIYMYVCMISHYFLPIYGTTI